MQIVYCLVTIIILLLLLVVVVVCVLLVMLVTNYFGATQSKGYTCLFMVLVLLSVDINIYSGSD